MSKWATLAVVSALIGFEADILGLLRYQIMSGSTTGSDRIRATPAVIITAFVLYVAMASLMALTKIGLPFNRPVAISSAIMSISAGKYTLAIYNVRQYSRMSGLCVIILRLSIRKGSLIDSLPRF